MQWYNDDEDFDFTDDMNEEERIAFEQEEREREERERNHPLVLKAKDIYELVTTLLDVMDEKQKNHTGSLMLEDIMIIRAKLAGAIGSESWQVCMQNASLIRHHGEHLRLYEHSIREFTNLDGKYVDLLRNEMEEFRLLFVEWMKEAHGLKDDFSDEWGLFRKNA